MLLFAVTSVLLLTTSSSHSYFILAVLLPAGLLAHSSNTQALGSQCSPWSRNEASVSSSYPGSSQFQCVLSRLPPERLVSWTPGTERKQDAGRTRPRRGASLDRWTVGGRPLLRNLRRRLEAARKLSGSEKEVPRRMSGTLIQTSSSAVRPEMKGFGPFLSRFAGSGNRGSARKGFLDSDGVTFLGKGLKDAGRVRRMERQERHKERGDKEKKPEEERDTEEENVSFIFPMRTFFIGKRNDAERHEERDRGRDRGPERPEGDTRTET